MKTKNKSLILLPNGRVITSLGFFHQALESDNEKLVRLNKFQKGTRIILKPDDESEFR